MAADELHQIVYRWTGQSPFDADSGPGFWPIGWSFGAPAALRLWHERVDPWLRTDPGGAPEPSLFYSVFGSDAVAVYRDQRPSVANATAHLLIGARRLLTVRLALELRGWDRTSVPYDQVLRTADLAAHRDVPDVSGRHGAAYRLLHVPLSRLLAGAEAVTAPAGEDAPRMVWMLDEILGVLATDLPAPPELSFDTFDDQPALPDRPGIHLRFRPDAPPAAPHPGTADAARALLETYRQDRANGLRALCHRHGVFEGRTLAERMRLLNRLRPAMAASSASRPSTVLGATMHPSPQAAEPSQEAADEPADGQVSCPICLGRLAWHDLGHYRYDLDHDDYVELDPASWTSPEQRAMAMRNAYVQCPDPGGAVGEHYLPADYGRHGPPAVFGLIGASNSGKSHLLAAMVGAIEQGGLGVHGVRTHPIELPRHQRYMRDVVRPLLARGRRIPPTRENIVQFVDGFVLSGDGVAGGATRPMALFDVAGSELAEVENAKRFLELADGLIFVVDPDLWERNNPDDVTFSTVINLLRNSGRLDRVSATVVLNKADLLKFDDPIAFWLRDDVETLTAEAALRESEEVYAYLHQRGARAWTRPYDDCTRATLHVASALGSDSFERGVQPRRVLRPLVALMAMTGLLSAPGAENVGV
ncbi:hypothetical protein GCM10010191_53100 [Actinomadura vinacea]|uniref:ATP-binding protein n=2 Tax=Actinomadura vinacea TaxID=115336 RepID=A0ABN3JJN3_9ACTN